MFKTTLYLLAALSIAFITSTTLAQDQGIPDTLRFEPSFVNWSITSDADSVFSVGLWLWTDDTSLRFGVIPIEVIVDGSGVSRNDSLIVVDTFIYSPQITASWKSYSRSLLDSSIDPSANNVGYNGFILAQMEIFFGSIYPTNSSVYVGELYLKAIDPSILPSSIEITVDSAFFPPYGDFLYCPGVGTGYSPVFTKSSIAVDNQLGPTAECGDSDSSGFVDIDDAVYLINYIFAGGPPPSPIESGDADCSGNVDIDDVVYLINYIFQGGNPPCDTDGDELPDC